MRSFRVTGIAMIFSGAAVLFAQTPGTQQAPQVIDQVAAVVGNEVILMSEVQEHLQSIMMQEGMDENASTQELQRLLAEVLNGMIDDQLLLVKAAQDSLDIDPALANESERAQFQQIRAQFATDAEFQAAILEFGMTEQQLRYMIREMVVKNQLQQMILQSVSRSISVTPQDMENWVAANADSLGEMPTQYRLSHILRYPQVSESRKETIRARLEDIRQQIMDGADFAEMAGQYSDDPGSKASGGDLGYFARNEMVPEFANAAFALRVGEISGVVESQFGYHLITVEDIRGDEIRARHILLMLEPTEDDARENIALLNRIRDDILAGRATFEDMAREYSEDENSKELGGRLQWLTRGEILQEFMDHADSLEAGGISEPFETVYGYHILRLDNVRQAHKLNVRDDSQIIRDQVMQLKSIAELDRILADLRAKTYIRIMLD